MTKIVCTIGPSCSDFKGVESLAEHGMNIARVNLSHGTHAQHAETVQHVSKLNSSGHCVAVLFDTKGAEIRTGERQTPLSVSKGQEVTFLPEGMPCNDDCISVNYDGFGTDVRETDRILIDNGELSFEIVSIQKDGVVVGRAKQDGTIGSRRHINLPGADVDLPSITDSDWEDIAFAVEQKADFIALSFIRTGDDIIAVRTFIEEKGSKMQIIAKIETAQAVENIAEIVDASDGIMVARGDLGAEVPFEDLFVIQNEIVTRCRDRGKPVIVATHMLESMKEHPIPTRAEVTDVAHAAETGADATMLSGETASGKHPPIVVDAMNRILTATECYRSRFDMHLPSAIHNEREAQAEAAVTLANTSEADALLVFTREGKTARLVSKFRPNIPIISIASTEEVQRKIQLCYGVYPLTVPFGDPEETVQAGLQAAKDAGLLSKGQKVVLISDAEAKGTPVSSVQVREVI